MAELIRRLAKSSKVSRGKGRRLLIQELDRLEAALMKILNIAAINNIYNARSLGSNFRQFYLETTREIKYKLDTKYTPHDRNITS